MIVLSCLWHCQCAVYIDMYTTLVPVPVLLSWNVVAMFAAILVATTGRAFGAVGGTVVGERLSTVIGRIGRNGKCKMIGYGGF